MEFNTSVLQQGLLEEEGAKQKNASVDLRVL